MWGKQTRQWRKCLRICRFNSQEVASNWYTRMFKLKHKMLSIKTKQTQISEPNIGSSCERRCARTSVTERLRTITKKFWGRGIFYSWIIRLIWCIKVVRWRTCSKIVIYRSRLLSQGWEREIFGTERLTGNYTRSGTFINCWQYFNWIKYQEATQN